MAFATPLKAIYTSGAVTSLGELVTGDTVDPTTTVGVFLDKGSSGTTTQTLDVRSAAHQKITTTGAFTLATTNWFATGFLSEILLELVNGAAFAVTWPSINWIKSDGTTTTTFASNGVTLQASGTDFVLLWSRDGGTTIYGKVMR
jgi:hypothetical protein